MSFSEREKVGLHLSCESSAPLSTANNCTSQSLRSTQRQSRRTGLDRPCHLSALVTHETGPGALQGTMSWLCLKRANLSNANANANNANDDEASF